MEGIGRRGTVVCWVRTPTPPPNPLPKAWSARLRARYAGLRNRPGHQGEGVWGHRGSPCKSLYRVLCHLRSTLLCVERADRTCDTHWKGESRSPLCWFQIMEKPSVTGDAGSSGTKPAQSWSSTSAKSQSLRMLEHRRCSHPLGSLKTPRPRNRTFIVLGP